MRRKSTLALGYGVSLTRVILACLISPIAYFLVYETALRFFPELGLGTTRSYYALRL